MSTNKKILSALKKVFINESQEQQAPAKVVKQQPKAIKQAATMTDEEIVNAIVDATALERNFEISKASITKDILLQAEKKLDNSLQFQYLTFRNCSFIDSLADIHFENIAFCRFINCEFKLAGRNGFEFETMFQTEFKKCFFKDGSIIFSDMNKSVFNLCDFTNVVISSYDDDQLASVNDTHFADCSFAERTSFQLIEFTGATKFSNAVTHKLDSALFVDDKCTGTFSFNKSKEVEGIQLQSVETQEVTPEKPSEDVVKQAVADFVKQEYTGKSLNQSSSDEDKAIANFIEWYNMENEDEPTTKEDWEVEEGPDKDSWILTSKEYNLEYLVCTDYDVAYDIAREAFGNLVEDLGLGKQGLVDWDYMGSIEGYLSADAKEELFRRLEDDVRDYFENGMDDEERRDGLERHNIEIEEDDDPMEYVDDYVEAYIELGDWTPDNALTYFEEQLGYDAYETLDYLFDDNLKYMLDIDEIFNSVVSSDGLGPSLAIYDGNEIEYKDTYIFRRD
jgi:hypothetical protein